ncbi:MAG: branched-chain amino acid aminotransferase [Polaribacter sp.]|jgi:branched-chain amino acid aminotransferase
MSDYSKGAAFIDKQIVPISEAKISLLDWGFLHSDATYDVAHVWQGKFFRLDDHIDRFYAGMKKLHLSIPYQPEEVKTILIDCVKATGLQDAYVEMIATRGMPQAGSRDPRTCSNRFYAFAIPFVRITPRDKGLHLVISDRQRIPAESIDPVIKNYQWLDLVMGQFEAYERGAESVVVVDAQGNITEGPGFNLFCIKDGLLTTPANGVLEGITRKTAMALAVANGYEVMATNIQPEYARAADEVFVTSTAGGIMAVTNIDGDIIGNGGIGPVTKQLQVAYWAIHNDPDYSLTIDYKE